MSDPLEGMTQKLIAKTIYYEDGTVETVRASEGFAIIKDPSRPIKEIVDGEYPARGVNPMLEHMGQK
jgi:hypothetical protein